MRRTILISEIIFFALFLNSCLQKSEKIKEITCKIDSSIDLFSDSTYFSDIRCMQYYKGRIYTLDVARRQIISFDENFNNTSNFGEAGLGPGELSSPYTFYICNDTTYISDYGFGIKSFYQNQYINCYKLPVLMEKHFFILATNFIFRL